MNELTEAEILLKQFTNALGNGEDTQTLLDLAEKASEFLEDKTLERCAAELITFQAAAMRAFNAVDVIIDRLNKKGLIDLQSIRSEGK